jgi:integrase
MRLTVKSVAELELPPGKPDHVEWDDDIAGFGLRIRSSGTRVWIYRYRIGRKQRSITLGSATAVPLARARANAGELEAKVRLGGDPAADKKAARAAASNLAGELIDQFLDAGQAEGRWRSSSLREVRRHLLINAKPLHDVPVTAISQREVVNLFNRIVDANGITTANRVRASLSAFLRWVIVQGISLPAGNVVANTEPKGEQSRTRVLTDAEIKAVWNGCRDDDHGAIVRLLLLTGQRAAEIGSLRWDEINGDRIELPETRTKNGRPHVIPLSTAAKEILDRRRIVGRTFVFGRDDSHGFRGWGVCKERLDSRAGIADWRVHDLRRTVATKMAESPETGGLGVLPHVVEAVLNHVSGHRAGVAGIYNKAAYLPDKRKALEQWAEHVIAIAGGGQ